MPEQTVCSHCGALVAESAYFCAACGTSMVAAGTTWVTGSGKGAYEHHRHHAARGTGAATTSETRIPAAPTSAAGIVACLISLALPFATSPLGTHGVLTTVGPLVGDEWIVTTLASMLALCALSTLPRVVALSRPKSASKGFITACAFTTGVVGAFGALLSLFLLVALVDAQWSPSLGLFVLLGGFALSALGGVAGVRAAR